MKRLAGALDREPWRLRRHPPGAMPDLARRQTGQASSTTAVDAFTA